jgi:hypothetical protein
MTYLMLRSTRICGRKRKAWRRNQAGANYIAACALPLARQNMGVAVQRG